MSPEKLMPLLPAGTMLWSGVSSDQIDFDSISHPGAVLLLATSKLANGAAVIVNGQVIDCVLVNETGLHFGPQLARELVDLANASYSASKVDEGMTTYLPMLWRNTPIYVDLDKRWIEVYGLMESVGEAGDDRVVTVESGTSRGVVIFSGGRAVAAYTSIDPRPSVAYQVALPLFHDGEMGTVNITKGSKSIPGPSLAVSGLAKSLVSGAAPGAGGFPAAELPPQPTLAPAPASQFNEPIPLFPTAEPGLPSMTARPAATPVLASIPAPEAPPGPAVLAKKMAQELSQQAPGNQVRFGFMVSQLLALSRQELGPASPVVEHVINSSEPTLEGLNTAIATVNALVPPGTTREQMANLVATMRMIVNDRFARG